MFAKALNINSINGKIQSISRLELATDIKIDKPSLIGIDGSTDCSGLAIKSLDGNLLYSIALFRSPNETAIQYKVAFKRFLTWLFQENPLLVKVFYEEPFIGFIESSKVLLSLATSVEEIIAEQAPKLDYLQFIDCSNKKWKQKFLGKIVGDSKQQKIDITEKVYELFPELKAWDITQDERDAIGLACVAYESADRNEEEALKDKEKVRKFKYSAQFIGANNPDEMLEEIQDAFRIGKVPQILVDDWMSEPDIITLSGKGSFNDHVMQNMGSKDKILVLEFKSDKYANILLEHRVSHLTTDVKYMYAIIWRKTRKAKKN